MNLSATSRIQLMFQSSSARGSQINSQCEVLARPQFGWYSACLIFSKRYTQPQKLRPFWEGTQWSF